MHSLAQRLADLVAHRRGLGWLLVAVVSIPAGLGWCGVALRPQHETPWITEDEAGQLSEFRRTAHRGYLSVFLVVEGDDLFTPARVAALRSLAARLKTIEGVVDVRWLNDVPQALSSEPFLPPPDASQSDMRRARDAALRHPLIRGNLLSEDARTLLMIVGVDGHSRQLLDDLDAAAKRVSDESGIQIRLTGGLPLPEQFRRSYWRPDDRQALLTARMQDLGIRRYETVVERLDALFQDMQAGLPGFRRRIGGEAIIEGRVVQRVVRDLGLSLLLASVVIFAVLTITLRSVRLGLICVVPKRASLIYELVLAAARFRSYFNASSIAARTRGSRSPASCSNSEQTKSVSSSSASGKSVSTA